jgi:hypothetical protein
LTSRRSGPSIAVLTWRNRAPCLHRGFLHALAALARRGNFVALSAAGHPAAVIDDAFDGVEVVGVGMDRDVNTLVQRELGARVAGVVSRLLR